MSTRHNESETSNQEQSAAMVNDAHHAAQLRYIHWSFGGRTFRKKFLNAMYSICPKKNGNSTSNLCLFLLFCYLAAENSDEGDKHVEFQHQLMFKKLFWSARAACQYLNSLWALLKQHLDYSLNVE